MKPGNADGLGDLRDLRDLEEALAQALHADAERITPSDRLAAIQAATTYEIPTRRRGPRLFTLVAAAAAAAVIGSVAAGQWLAPHDRTRPGGTVSLSSPATTGLSQSPTAVAGAALPVYFPVQVTIDGTQVWRLTRTFVSGSADAGASGSRRVLEALQWSASDRAWPYPGAAPLEGTAVAGVDVTPQLITIVLTNGGAQDGTDDYRRLGIQQLVWTAQAAAGLGRVPVTFQLETGAGLLFGRFPASDRYDRPDTAGAAAVIAPIWIDQPGTEATVRAGVVHVKGLAAAPEGTLVWSLHRGDGAAPVAQGSTQAEAGAPAQAPYAFDIPAVPGGRYRLEVGYPSPKDGSATGVTQVWFTVS